ncbi:MAG TPA: hypothetical protein VKY85_27915 [Candidatus Angelobacter sp.]|nr:hypothetical protein [Candidatus Angelobacter sp.]
MPGIQADPLSETGKPQQIILEKKNMRSLTTRLLFVLFLMSPAPFACAEGGDSAADKTAAAAPGTASKEEVEQLRKEVESQRQTIEELKATVQQLVEAKTQTQAAKNKERRESGAPLKRLQFET